MLKKQSHILNAFHLAKKLLVWACHRQQGQHGEGEAWRVGDVELCVEGVVCIVG